MIINVSWVKGSSPRIDGVIKCSERALESTVTGHTDMCSDSVVTHISTADWITNQAISRIKFHLISRFLTLNSLTQFTKWMVGNQSIYTYIYAIITHVWPCQALSIKTIDSPLFYQENSRLANYFYSTSFQWY